MQHWHTTRETIRLGYNAVAERYAAHRERFGIGQLEEFTKSIPPACLVLDVGCGAGLPIDGLLTERGFGVIGIDISERMIQLARNNVPKGQYTVEDIMEAPARTHRVSGIVSYYCIFHTPREKHMELFGKFNSFLPIGGAMLITMGSSDWEGEGEFHGTTMWWSHYGPVTNRLLVERAGFDILRDTIDVSGEEKHQMILALKRREAHPQ